MVQLGRSLSGQWQSNLRRPEMELRKNIFRFFSALRGVVSPAQCESPLSDNFCVQWLLKLLSQHSPLQLFPVGLGLPQPLSNWATKPLQKLNFGQLEGKTWLHSLWLGFKYSERTDGQFLVWGWGLRPKNFGSHKDQCSWLQCDSDFSLKHDLVVGLPWASENTRVYNYTFPQCIYACWEMLLWNASLLFEVPLCLHCWRCCQN